MNENSPRIRWLNGLSGPSECQASRTYLMRSSRRRRSQGALFLKVLSLHTILNIAADLRLKMYGGLFYSNPR